MFDQSLYTKGNNFIRCVCSMRVGEITQCACSKGSNYTFPVWLRVIVNTFLPRVRVNYKYYFT